MEYLIFYYIFSVLFMIGYVNTRGETIFSKLFIYFIEICYNYEKEYKK